MFIRLFDQKSLCGEPSCFLQFSSDAFAVSLSPYVLCTEATFLKFFGVAHSDADVFAFFGSVSFRQSSQCEPLKLKRQVFLVFNFCPEKKSQWFTQGKTCRNRHSFFSQLYPLILPPIFLLLGCSFLLVAGLSSLPNPLTRLLLLLLGPTSLGGHV